MSEDKPHYHGHRGRLRQRLLEKGGETLADYEILEFLLFGARARGDTKALAKALIDRFGSLGAVLTAEPRDLASVSGMGETSIAALKIVPEAARRLAREQVIERPVVGSWDKLLDYCRIALGHEKVERFHLLKNIFIRNINYLFALRLGISASG
jgi:DNA repair protein RadC